MTDIYIRMRDYLNYLDYLDEIVICVKHWMTWFNYDNALTMVDRYDYDLSNLTQTDRDYIKQRSKHG